MKIKSLRTSVACDILGVSAATLRKYANEGKIPVHMLGRERRFYSKDLDEFMGITQTEKTTKRVEALYVRVSSTTGQETSISSQKQMLNETSTGTIYKTLPTTLLVYPQNVED